MTDLFGPDKVIKSREEFEALLRMRAADLREEQVHAINQIRLHVGMPHLHEPLARVVALDGTFGAENLLQTGNPNLGGFFARKADIAGTRSTQSLIDRLRLDASPNNFIPGQAHAIIETRATQAIRDAAHIPRSADYPGDFSTGGPLNIVDDFHYPGTGNGFTAATDGHLVPEFRIPDESPVPMTAGYDFAGDPVTVMKVRNPDGSSFPLTINGQTASDWKLIVDPANSERTIWVPLE